MCGGVVCAEGESIDACKDKRESLLMQSAKAKHCEVVKLLMDKAASAASCDNDECALLLRGRTAR